jgi:hypothetical protein
MITRIETKQDGDGKTVTEQKYNHLAPAEMMKEDNFNKIDGIIDTSSKPTFEERMKDAKSRVKDHNSRKTERHKKSRHGNKSERHKKERH